MKPPPNCCWSGVENLARTVHSMTNAQSIRSLPGLGPKSEAMLACVGIMSVQQLRKLGSVRAFVMVKHARLRPSLNLLWALEGALTGQPWQHVAREHRTSLLLAVEERERDACW